MVSIQEGTRNNLKTKKSGLGIIISKNGEFIVSRSLVKDSIRYPGLTYISVTNKDGAKLSGLKLSKCGLVHEMDICLMRVNYSPLFYFKFIKKPLKQEQPLHSFLSIKGDKLQPITGHFASYRENNFVDIFLSKFMFDRYDSKLKPRGIPRGAPLFTNSGELAGQVVTYLDKYWSDEIPNALTAREIELFILKNRFFYPIKRSRDTNYFLSELERLLREKKPLPNASISDLRHLRSKEMLIQKYWPSYKATIDAKGVQELKKLYKQANRLSSKTRFKEDFHGTNEEKAQRIMGRRQKIRNEIASVNQELQNLEMKLSKDNSNSSAAVIDKKIGDTEKEINKLKEKIGQGQKLKKEQSEKMKGNKNKKEVEMFKKGIEITSENIISNKSRIKELQEKISQLKIQKSSSSKSNSPTSEKYNLKVKELGILNGKLESLDKKAFDLFEDAI